MRVIDGGGEGSVVSILRFKRSKPLAARGCEHRAVKIDTDDRVLECRDCGADVDPIAYIAFLSRTWEDVRRAEERRIYETKQINEKLAVAEKDLARIRARVSRERAKLGEVSESRAYKAGIEKAAERLHVLAAHASDEAHRRYLKHTASVMEMIARDAERDWRPEPVSPSPSPPSDDP